MTDGRFFINDRKVGTMATEQRPLLVCTQYFELVPYTHHRLVPDTRRLLVAWAASGITILQYICRLKKGFPKWFFGGRVYFLLWPGTKITSFQYLLIGFLSLYVDDRIKNLTKVYFHKFKLVRNYSLPPYVRVPCRAVRVSIFSINL